MEQYISKSALEYYEGSLSCLNKIKALITLEREKAEELLKILKG